MAPQARENKAVAHSAEHAKESPSNMPSDARSSGGGAEPKVFLAIMLLALVVAAFAFISDGGRAHDDTLRAMREEMESMRAELRRLREDDGPLASMAVASSHEAIAADTWADSNRSRKQETTVEICDADVNRNGAVSTADLLLVLSSFGASGCPLGGQSAGGSDGSGVCACSAELASMIASLQQLSPGGGSPPPPVPPPPPPPRPLADSPWETQFDSTLERSDQTAQYRLSQCPGEPYTWLGSFINGELPAGAELTGNAYLDGRFGAVLNGDGDHITIGPSSETVAYAATGEFTISMWFTKRECSDASPSNGRYETIFRQTAGSERRSFGEVFRGDTPNAITMFVGCSAAGVRSTLDGDIVRTVLVDSQANRATFDWSVQNERGGGYVTDKWVHMVLAVSHTSMQVFLDGTAVENFGFAGSSEPWAGASDSWDNMDWAQTDSNLAYIGRPTGRLQAMRPPRTLGTFEMTGPISVGGDRGYSAFTGEMALVSLYGASVQAETAQCIYFAGEGLVGVCPNLDDPASGGAGVSWIVHQNQAQVSGDVSLDGDAHLQGSHGEFGVLLDGDDDQLTITGATASQYARDGAFTVSLWFSRSECETTTQPWSRSSTLFSQNKGGTGWNQFQATDSTGFVGTGACFPSDPRQQPAPDCDYNAEDPSTCDAASGCTFGTNTNVNILLVCPSSEPSSSIDGPVVRITLGDDDGGQVAFDFSFSAFDTLPASAVKQWAHLVLSVDHGRVDVFVDGRPVTEFGFPNDYMSDTNLAYNGDDTTTAITWDTATKGLLGDFTFTGIDITIGAMGNRREFEGDIAMVSLHDTPVIGTDADCLYQYGEQQIAVCEDYASRSWRGPMWLLFNGTMHEQATLNGDAELDAGFGVLLDGRGDSITVMPEGSYSSSLNYAKDAQFGISMWFTRKTCPIPGRYEALYTHAQVDATSSDWMDPTNSGIHILIGCAGGDGLFGEHSTIPGDILRFIFVDDDQHRMTFDVPLAAAPENGIGSDWIHLAVGVDTDAVQVFINGLSVPSSGFGFATDPPSPGYEDEYTNRWAWATTAENIAYPAPSSLTQSLNGFGMSGIGDNADYYTEMTLAPGAHYFRAIDKFGDGWQGGWFQVMDGPCGSLQSAVLVGAPAGTSTTSGVLPAVGAPEGAGGVYAFMLAGEAPSAVCVHIHTGDWASEYDWNFDGDSDTAMVPPEPASITIGGGRWSSFMGGIAVVSVHGRTITEFDAQCLWNFGSDFVATCPDISRSSYGQRWLIFNGTLALDAALHGDAFMDSDMGVTLDGDGDYVSVSGDNPNVEPGYSHDGTFSISLWATRGECNAPGSYELLYGHQQSTSRWSGNWVDPDNVNIHMLIGCASRGSHSTLEGDVIRTLLVDDEGHRVAFDWSLSNAKDDGDVNRQWVHIVLSVSSTAVKTFVDGTEVTEFGYPIGGWQGQFDFAMTEANMAWPDGPSNMSGELVGFGISKYADNEDYFIPVPLEPGPHVLSGVDTFGDGWQGGWFELLDSNGRTLVGGADSGAVQADTLDLSFGVATSQVFTVHVHTGRWGNEVRWYIDDGIVTDEETGSTSGYGGPRSTSEIQLGGSGYGGFQGQLGGVSIVSHAVQANEARCLYESGAQFVGICPNFESRWRTEWLVKDTAIHESAELHGDAALNGKFGLTLDGSGDYLTASGSDIMAYASSGEFGISMWFTRRECVTPGRYEMLFGHHLDEGYSFWTPDSMLASSSIHIFIGCAQSGVHSTLSGDIVRTILVDDASPRQRMSFDWSLNSAADNGPANRQWVHMVLSVTHGSTQVFVDGLPATAYGFGLDDPDDTDPTSMHANQWMRTVGNLAYEASGGQDVFSGPIIMQNGHTWGGFGLSGYGDNSDYYEAVDLDAGEHVFHALDQWGDGWQGGYFEVLLCTGPVHMRDPCATTRLLLGGPQDGTVQGDGKHLSFSLVTDGTIQVHLNTGVWASEVKWSVDNGGRGREGPSAAHTISVGGQDPGWSTFMGEIQAVSLHREGLSQHDVSCLRDYGELLVAQCPAEMGRGSWSNNWVIMNGTLSDSAILQGDATVDDDPSFGVNFDGENDAVLIGGSAASSYALDGTFAISFWFTKRECDVPGRYEELFHQSERDGYGAYWSGSAIIIEIGCASGGVHSTIPGDIIRTLLRDADGKTVSFDWSVTEESSNGYVNSLWAHMVLSVDTNSVMVYVDGKAVTNFGYQTDGRGFRADSEDNLAYPDGPAALSDSLGRFPVGSTFKDEDDYWVPVVLQAGSHIFHAVDTYGDGWQGGWVELLDAHGAVVFGGEENGAPEDDGADYSFTITSAGTFTVHIKTGRWASEYQWSIDDGSLLLEDGSVDTSGGYSGPPPVHSIVVGDGGSTGFSGSINTMALHRSPQSAEDAMCLYEFGKSWIAMCQDPSRTWSVDWLVSDQVSDGATIGGDASFDGEFGLVFDGDGDYVSFAGDEVIQYAADASFGISLWFTRKSCESRMGWYEMIFSHQVGDDFSWEIDDAHIYVMVGCASRGTHSTVGGNIVRTEMQDGAGNQLAFDWSIPEGNGESYINQWLHMVLAVESSSIRVYADGERITEFGYEVAREGCSENYCLPLARELNLAYPEPSQLTGALQGFTLQGFADQSDYLTDVILEPGAHTFHAVDRFGDGWQGGYFEVGYGLGAIVNGEYVPGQRPVVLIGGVSSDGTGPGVVVTDGQHLSFRVLPGETRTLQVHIKTGDWASEYEWSIDDGSDFKGPPSPNPLTLGGSSNGFSSFMGSIAAASLHRNAPTDHDAKCMFEYGQSLIAMCQDFSGKDNWRINWLLVNGTASEDVAMNGDTRLDGTFGAVFDGLGDSLSVIGDSTTYATDGTFGISFWFTKHQCSTPGRYEMLWRHEQDGWNSCSIHMYVGCSSAGIDSTIDGDIVRTQLVDADGKRVSFDWGVSAERSNGAVNSEWVHVVLSVDHDSVQTFVDGRAVIDYGYDARRRSWTTTAENLAWPDGPTQLTGRLGQFPISAGYEAQTDVYDTIELAPGDYTFATFADWGSWHGGWFSITTQSGEVIAGGEDNKPDRSENRYSFTVGVDRSMSPLTAKCLLTLRITTGRWASDISWTLVADGDDGGDPLYSGPPPNHSVQIAGTGYLGSINSISLHRSPLGAKDAECLYDYGMQYVEICRDFSNNMILANDMISDDVSFVGDATRDGNMGVRLDGENDAIVVDGASTYYAASGEFSISFWVTKNECVKPGRWEMLWSHQEYGGWRGWGRGSSIHVYIRCGNDGESTVAGNLIRTALRDDLGQTVNFDVSTSLEADNGYINSQWIHLVLSVSHDKVQMFVDGNAVSMYGYETSRCPVGSDCTDCGSCPADGGLQTNNDACEYLGVTGAVANDGQCDEPTQQTDQNLAWCGDDAVEGVCTGPLELSSPLGSFAMGGYADNEDYYVDLVLEEGDHIFHGQDTFGDGWQGGWFELTQIEPGCYASAGVPSPASLSCQCHISCSACGYGGDEYSPTGAGDCITCADGSPVTPIFGDGTGTCSFTGQPAPPPIRRVGGAQNGAVDADWGHWAFSVESQTVVTLHLHTGDWAVEMAWSVEGAGCAETGQGDDMPGCNGPTGHAMSIGGSMRGENRVSGAYFGAFSAVSVHNRALDAEDVRCLNELGSGMIEVCQDPRDSSTNEWVVFNGTLYNGASLVGDAYMDPRAGVIVDGDGDAIAVGGDLAATYAPDGSFSISMWFTKRECTDQGRLEMLYAHSERSDGSWWIGETSHIHVYIGCSEQGTHSTLDGDIVRTSMADREGNRLSFDWPIAAERAGGLVNNMWVHMILSVSPGSVQVYADGEAIQEYGFQIDSRSSAWVTTSENLAYPGGPVELSSRLQGFGMGSAYAWDKDYFVPLVVPAGDHTFHGWSTSQFSSGWNGGWFELIGTNGDTIVGGVEAGRISGENDRETYNADTSQNDYDFTIDEAQTITLHIKTGRWANYMKWSISADPQLGAPEPAFSGPPAGEPFYVGGDSGWFSSNAFKGTIASVSISRRDTGAKDARCLYEFGMNNLEICEDPSWRMHHLVFNGNATGDGMGNNAMTMLGDAHFEGTQLVLDGSGDLIGVSGDAALEYSSGGDFSLSMWFTRKECTVAGQTFEQLFYHDSSSGISGASTSKVSVFIGCTDSGTQSTLVIGDVVRTVLEDVAGNRATFDWSIAAERSTGLINQNWVHMLLSVNNAPTTEQPFVQVFVDGAAVSNFGFPPSDASAANMAYTCGTPVCASTILNLNPMLGAFGMGGYSDRSVYHVQLRDLSEGPHQFHGMDSGSGGSGDGWEGGYYTVCVGQCDPNDAGVVVLSGGRETGRPTGGGTTFPEFVTSAGMDVWLMINTGDFANEISWDITNSDYVYPPVSGGSTVYLGGCSPTETDPLQCSAGPFLGSIAMVSLIYDDRDAAEADCIYQWSKDYIELCPDPAADFGTSFALKWLDGITPAGVTLSAGATVSTPRPGINLGGADYATLKSGGGFASGDGEYSISVWFSKSVCEPAADGTRFTLLAQDEVGDQSRSYIAAIVICGSLDSTLAGDVIRIGMADANGVNAMVDVPLDSSATRSGGIVTDQWLNLAWSVTSGDDDDGPFTAIRVFIDGNPVPDAEIGWPVDGQPENIAHPQSSGSPSRFSARFGDFNMDRSYPSNEDSIETIVGLSPGVTYTFTGFDEWGDGWDENGWFEVIVTTVDGGPMEADDVQGRRILGGPTAGQVEGSGGVPRPFTMPAECGGVGECTVAIRIAAHRAGNEISWEMRDTTDDSVVGYGPRSAPLYLGATPSSEPSSGPCPGGSVCATNGQILVDMFVGELGGVVAWRWDRGFDPSCIWQNGPMSNQASAATGQQGAWSQVTPVVTTSATSLDGSWNTYRLIASLEPTAAEKLYSIYGTPESPMRVPAAFQAAAPFGANIGGVNPGFFAVSAEAEFDSWLTVGVTGGTAGGLSSISSIGIPFASWTVDSGIETTAGSVFWLNPPAAPGGDVVVAQLTVGRGVAVTCAFGLMGISPAGADDWQADNVLWSLAPPPPTPPPPPPPPSSGRVEVVSTNGVAGMTTVRLTITLSATQSNVYAMFGTRDTPMFFPPAYQVALPFGADVGGVNPAFFAFANNDQIGYAQFDSWLTIGVTDGSAAGAIAASPGFDIGSQWTADTPLSQSDGAIFFMDPGTAPGGPDPIVMAQLTLSAADSASGTATAGLQGWGTSQGTANDGWQMPVTWSW